ALVVVAHDAGDLREQGVVLAAADVDAGHEPGPALAHEDRAAVHGLAAERLDAEPLRVGVAAVARRALSLFVCHGRVSSAVNLQSLRCAPGAPSGGVPSCAGTAWSASS